MVVFFDYLTTNNEWSGKNSLIQYQNDKYSEEQEQTHNFIKSIYNSDLDYRKITRYLIKNIKYGINCYKNVKIKNLLTNFLNYSKV